MKKVLLILLITISICYSAFGASTKIEDRTSSGYRADVEKVGNDYGVSTVIQGKKYMICNKDDDGTPNYYGFEAADGSWIIIKETVSAGADVYAYDSGSSGYSTAWTNRASGSYYSYGTEF